MTIKVIKRDGQLASFDPQKITIAVNKAVEAAKSDDDRLAFQVAKYVITRLPKDNISVEQIQEMVEDGLIESGTTDVTKQYIRYRASRNVLRENKNTFVEVKKLVGEWLNGDDWRTKENSNADISYSALLGFLGETIIAKYSLSNIMGKDSAKAHVEGYNHTHDLGNWLSPYCMGWGLNNLIAKGFGGVPNKAECKPAKHLDTLVHQMVNFIGTLQMEFAGAMSFSSVDTYLAPFVHEYYIDRYHSIFESKMDVIRDMDISKEMEDRIKQSAILEAWQDTRNYTRQKIQQLIFSLNIPSRWASQAPFSNLSFDWIIRGDLGQEPAIVGGKLYEYIDEFGKKQSATYGDFQKEMDLINEMFIKQMIEGDADGRVFSLHPEEKVIIFDKNESKMLIEPIGKIIDKYLLEEGNIEINDLEAMSLDFDTYKTEFKPITHLIKHKEKNTCVEVKTAVGNKFKVTKGHSMFKFTKEGKIVKCSVDKLKKNDLIVGVKKIKPFLTDDIKLPLIKTSRLDLGDYVVLDENLTWLFGFFAGNGHVTYTDDKLHAVGFSTLDKQLQDIIIEKLESVFGGIKIGRRNKEVVVSTRIVSQLFYDTFKGKVKAHEKHVPDVVLNSFHYKSFIDGYFDADGYTDDTKIRTVSKEMAETLRVLFLYDGYKCHIRKYDYGIRPRYQLTFRDNELKKNVFPLWYYIRDNIIKKNCWFVKDYENYKRKNISVGKVRELYEKLQNRGKIENVIIKDDLIEKILNGDIFLERIISKKNIEYEGFVYDFSVEDTNAFIGNNGVVYHNTFPIPTYGVDEAVDRTTDNWKSLMELTAKYGTPTFDNFGTKTGRNRNESRAMCCRLKLDLKEVEEHLQKLQGKTGSLFGNGEQTGSISVITINTNRIAYESSLEHYKYYNKKYTDNPEYDDIKRRFFRKLEHQMDIARNTLEVKRKEVKKNYDMGLTPYTKAYLHNFDSHFSTIGVIGMHEACLNIFGEEGIASEHGLEFAKETLNFMRERLKAFQHDTGNLYNLEATPAESACYRLAKSDLEHYGEGINQENFYYPPIIVSGSNGSPYLTNSTNLPSGYSPDPWEVIRHQDELLGLYTGGSVFHWFNTGRFPDWKIADQLVNYFITETGIPFFDFCPDFTVCGKCHKDFDKHINICPSCGNTDLEQFTRVVGYWRPKRRFNKGKLQEADEREKLDSKTPHIDWNDFPVIIQKNEVTNQFEVKEYEP